MKMAKFISIFSLIALVSIFMPSFALAGGAGIEPGDNCEEALGGEFSYDAPPFIGNLTVKLIGDNVVATGDLELAGSECNVAVELNLGPYSPQEFSQLNNRMIKGSCITDDFSVFHPCTGQTDGKLEIIAVGGIDWSSPTMFDGKFIIMPLK